MRALVYEMTNPITNEVVIVKTLDEARTLKAQGYTQEFSEMKMASRLFTTPICGETKPPRQRWRARADRTNC